MAADHRSLLRHLVLMILSLPFFFFVFFQSCTPLAAAANHFSNHSFLELPRGLNLSMLPSYNASDGTPLSYDLMFTVAMPVLNDDQGMFFPILNSPFLINGSSDSRSFSVGFSLGFYFGGPVHDQFGPQSMYLAVCAGLPGNNTESWAGRSPNLYQALYSAYYGKYILAAYTTDVFVLPVWIANLDKPIKDWERASLGVAADSSSTNSNVLQLKEGEKVVWNVSGVGMMEMRDSGDLLIFSHDASPSSTNVDVVWQSFDNVGTYSDTLVEGQKLRVGGELRSSDSNYLGRMEKGGLVLYLNNVHFGSNIDVQGLQQPAGPVPYWILPVFNPSAPAGSTINQLISTAPCSNSPAFAVLEKLVSGATSIHLDPGSCILIPNNSVNVSSGIAIDFIIPDNASWSFLKLKNDGRLSIGYSVNNPDKTAASVTKSIALDSPIMGGNSSYLASYTNSQWGPDCDVPMACGPAGLCNPGAKTLCSCPFPYFEPRNDSDFSQGCKRQSSLPVCTSNEHIDSTDFLELPSTASIFLFNGWSFNATQLAPHAPVADCKSLCSSICSCHGFFYKLANHSSACFFITDEFTLLKLVDTTLTFWNYTSFEPSYQNILARNYATYLKVASLPSGSDSRSTATMKVILRPTIVAAARLLLAIGIITACAGFIRFFRARKRKLAQVRVQAEEEKELQDILPLLPSRFSYKDLHEATKGFSKLLGAGGCGSVYAGVLWDGRKVAVKVLQVAVLQGAEQSRQFLAEVGTVGRTSHHNIVRLYGFCWEVSHRLLVYEYVERGSLDHWLFNVDERLLDWETRYNVALGIGRGMHYLHEECQQPILHFDIKPQNILLGDDFGAKLADFGMSRLIQRDASSVVTGVRGTPGYIAPEWFSHGKVSKKSDVFSMGMVLLELVGGRKILDFSFLMNSSLGPIEQEAWHLPSWAASKCEQGLMMQELVDKRLRLNSVPCAGGGGFDEVQAQRLIHIAFWCIHDDPAMRPSALMVVQWLEGISPRRVPSFSTVVSAALNKPLATKSVYDESRIDHISMF